MKWLLFRLRWWRWLLSAPLTGLLAVRGLDKHSRDIIHERWLQKEPKR